MKGASFLTVATLAVVAVMVISSEMPVAEAATCNPSELSPCMSAIVSSAPPTAACCSKLREQQPCLCGYLKNPSLGQYVNNPNAKKVASTCGVTIPQC